MNELCENSVKEGKSITKRDGSKHIFRGAILTDHWETSIGTKVYFTGYSEQILERKFIYMGIDKQHNSWIYRPLPMSIVRYERNRGRSAFPQCTYLGTRHIYGHIRTTHYHSTALDVGCVHSILSLHEKSDICESRIKKLVPSYREIFENPQPALIDLKVDCDTTRSNQSVITEINFMPFLIKTVNISQTNTLELCLTVNDTTLALSFSPCVRYATLNLLLDIDVENI